MIYIGEYEELVPGKGFDSMKDYLSSEPYPGQAQIIRYLRNGTPDIISMKSHKDIFTGKIVTPSMISRNDGVYSWWDVLAYYASKYNLRLPGDFEKHILLQKVK